VTFALLAKLVRVLLGMGLVVGIVGRDVTLRRAARAGTSARCTRCSRSRTSSSGRSSLILGIVLLVPAVFLPRSRVFGAALTAAEARGGVTP
jgi:hypothetical protein